MKKFLLNLEKYKCIVIGVSAGGMNALTKLFFNIPENFPLPILVVQHVHKSQDGFFITHYNDLIKISVEEASDKKIIKAGHLYFAPPDYHLLVDDDKAMALSSDEKVNYSRPSIDVLFDSAADVYGSELIGIVLTGANCDGTTGLEGIKQKGGFTIVQDPVEAEFKAMPKAAIDRANPHFVGSINEIANLLFKD